MSAPEVRSEVRPEVSIPAGREPAPPSVAPEVRAGSPARPVWWAVLAVAVCGVVATAHGLYGVARACGVDWRIAGLYPVLADGLALAAYWATTRVAHRGGRAYAWLVVVLAAGLSALAQGALGAGLGEPDRALRFGVHAAPAVVVAVAAHLLWLTGRTPNVSREALDVRSAAEIESPTHHPVSPASGLLADPSELLAEPAREPSPDGLTEPAQARAGLRLAGSARRGRRAGPRVLCEHCGERVGMSTRKRHLAAQRAAEAAG